MNKKERKVNTKRLSKIGQWLISDDEPVVDFSVMSEAQKKAMYKAIMK